MVARMNQKRTFFPRKLKLGKDVAEERTGEEHLDDVGEGDGGRVAIVERQRQIFVLEYLDIILEGEGFREEGRRHLAQLSPRLERAENHPHKGQKRNQAQQGE